MKVDQLRSNIFWKAWGNAPRASFTPCHASETPCHRKHLPCHHSIIATVVLAWSFSKEWYSQTLMYEACKFNYNTCTHVFACLIDFCRGASLRWPWLCRIRPCPASRHWFLPTLQRFTFTTTIFFAPSQSSPCVLQENLML